MKKDNPFNNLTEAVEYYQGLGYTHIFLLDKKQDHPDDWYITGFYKFDDNTGNSIVFLLQKKNSPEKGLLINAHGIYSSSKITRFIEHIRKNNQTNSI